MPYEIPDFRSNGGPPRRVTVLRRDEADAVLGTLTRAERTAHLRGCRDLGLMLTNPGRLTHRVRVGTTPKGYARKEACYVFICTESEIPRKRRPDRGRVSTW